MQSISIALGDAHNLVRLGLKSLFSEIDYFHIVAEATNEKDLLAKIKRHKPQVVILDYNQPNHFSVDTVEQIKSLPTGTNVLVITADNNKPVIYQILECGVSSFLTKNCGENEIIEAVKATAKGEKFFCNKILEFLLEKSFAKDTDKNRSTPLTNREIEIVQLVAKGLLAKEIAGVLNLSTHTVYTHRKNIMKKLHLNTSSELVLYAVNQGII